jgi:SAM-dependent methyltransferase
MDNPYEAQDKRYRKFKRRNPDVSFAKYAMDRVVRRMENGSVTNPDAALTIALCNPEKFWEAAEPKAQKWFKTMALKKSNRMIEYGCGSMRLGAHFIRYLDPGCFFGMDVVAGFYEVWRDTIGAELAAAKKPKLAVIDERAIQDGIAFGADIVCSNTVCVHVHPDEIDEYFDNMIRLTAKPGARLVFNAVICDRPHRFEFNSWAWPLDFYKERMKTLDLMNVEIGRAKEKDGGHMNLVEFEFRRG